MISILQGEIIEKNEDSIIIMCHGVGYEVFCISENFYLEDNIKIHIYHHMTAEKQSLFGFIDKFEKALFLKLTNVNKIGPKTGLNILQLGTSDVLKALQNNDVKFLQKAKGLGKKSAERLVLELGNGSLEDILNEKSSIAVKNDDAIYALRELGFRDKYIKDCLAGLPEHIQTTESIIKYFLQNQSIN